jgi:D-beta-D-heptose 7-phosphate kinase/D-beta-D-heptose 1-phosphate adenosyltransferase
VVVEPKGGDHIRYRGADVLMPGRRELAEATGMPVATSAEIVAASRVLIERCGLGAVFVLLGREGMILVEPRTSTTVDPLALADGYDPGGTEDAAVAALAVGIGAGLSVPHAAELASFAVGIVGAKVGTAVVSAGELAWALASAAYLEPGEAAARVEVAPQPHRRGQRKA